MIFPLVLHEWKGVLAYKPSFLQDPLLSNPPPLTHTYHSFHESFTDLGVGGRAPAPLPAPPLTPFLFCRSRGHRRFTGFYLWQGEEHRTPSCIPALRTPRAHQLKPPASSTLLFPPKSGAKFPTTTLFIYLLILFPFFFPVFLAWLVLFFFFPLHD